MFGTLHLRAAIVLAALLATLWPAAAAEKRVALVIGNAGYIHVTPPATAVNDARLVAKTLRGIGFAEVLEHYDLNYAAMIAALDAFAARAETADWALIYYAGHGLEVFGRSFLAPIDAKLANAADLTTEAITPGRLLAKLGRQLKLKIVILDMPRANPFGSARPPLVYEKELSGEGDEFVAFATQTGNVLSKSEGSNGAFALALTQHIVVPGIEIRDLFGRIRQDVMRATGSKQIPWETAALSGSHYFVP